LVEEKVRAAVVDGKVCELHLARESRDLNLQIFIVILFLPNCCVFHYKMMKDDHHSS
jgi:hypothetical protein